MGEEYEKYLQHCSTASISEALELNTTSACVAQHAHEEGEQKCVEKVEAQVS